MYTVLITALDENDFKFTQPIYGHDKGMIEEVYKVALEASLENDSLSANIGGKTAYFHKVLWVEFCVSEV